MAELIGHLVALMDVDGATVKVGLDVPGNEAYLDAIMQGGRTVRGPTDEELARDIRSTPAFQSEGQFSPQSYFRVVRGVFRETPQGYEEMRRRSLIAGRLKQLIFHAAKLSPAELDAAFASTAEAASCEGQR